MTFSPVHRARKFSEVLGVLMVTYTSVKIVSDPKKKRIWFYLS